MTAEVIEAKVTTMESDLREIKNDLKEMPQQIADKIKADVDLKIKLAISETESKYQLKFIAMLIAIVSEGIGLIAAFVFK